MRNLAFRFLFLGFLVVASCARTPDFVPAKLAPGQWKLDPDHASIIFTISHAKGLSQFTARFDTFDAQLFFDAANPQASKIMVEIDATSVNTGVAALDRKLIAHSRVFAAKTYPVIRFESTSISQVHEHDATVFGMLTLRGQSRPIEMMTTWNGTSFDPLRNSQVLGFSAQARFDRTDFGADAWKNFGVGTEIHVTIEVEFVKASTPQEN